MSLAILSRSGQSRAELRSGLERKSNNEPPATSSVTMQGGCRQKPRSRTRFGCANPLMIQTSCRNSS
jgi:hypothetical protein